MTEQPTPQAEQEVRYFQMPKDIFLRSISEGLAGMDTDEALREVEGVTNKLNELWDGLLAREFEEEFLSVVVGTTGTVVGEVHIFYKGQQIDDTDTPDMFPKESADTVVPKENT